MNEEYYNFKELNEVLDKLAQLKKENKRTSPIKIIVCAAGSIAVLIFLTFLCFSFYHNHFTIESLLSIALAFFSIFISIIFYFKAEETSNQFYDKSYTFMKDMSVTLGKIEERFGEQLKTINEKITDLNNQKKEISHEIQSIEDDKDKFINELLEKATINEEEKKKYQENIDEKNKQIRNLKNKIRKIESQQNNISCISGVKCSDSIDLLRQYDNYQDILNGLSNPTKSDLDLNNEDLYKSLYKSIYNKKE